jgi:hypothetical protein
MIDLFIISLLVWNISLECVMKCHTREYITNTRRALIMKYRDKTKKINFRNFIYNHFI